jgi:hypothetical protein
MIWLRAIEIKITFLLIKIFFDSIWAYQVISSFIEIPHFIVISVLIEVTIVVIVTEVISEIPLS